MRKQLYRLSDEEWRRIEPLLPRGRRGAHRVDDRRVISGIMHMLRSGARWRSTSYRATSKRPLAPIHTPAKRRKLLSTGSVDSAVVPKRRMQETA